MRMLIAGLALLGPEGKERYGFRQPVNDIITDFTEQMYH